MQEYGIYLFLGVILAIAFLSAFFTAQQVLFIFLCGILPLAGAGLAALWLMARI